VRALAAALAGVAVWLAWPMDPDVRLARVLGRAAGSGSAERSGTATHRRETLAAVLAGVAVAVAVGGVAGAVVGGGVALGVRKFVARLEPAAVRAERARLAADLPLATTLMTVAVQAGVSLPSAAESVGQALGGPLGRRLSESARAAVVGVVPTDAWRALLEEPGLAQLGRAIVRSEATGTSAARVLAAVSEDAVAAARWHAHGRARSLGPRTALPLGLCFLPAFIVVGVLPFIASTAATVLP
jgi:Flp pilus assembly protein TadB